MRVGEWRREGRDERRGKVRDRDGFRRRERNATAELRDAESRCASEADQVSFAPVCFPKGSVSFREPVPLGGKGKIHFWKAERWKAKGFLSLDPRSGAHALRHL